jgi:RHS repeat-associated protein
MHCFAQLPGQGYLPYGAYQVNDIDSINLSNRNVILDIPLVSYKQKGTLPDVGIKLLFNTPSWVGVTDDLDCDSPPFSQGGQGQSCNYSYYQLGSASYYQLGSAGGVSPSWLHVFSSGEVDVSGIDSSGDYWLTGRYFYIGDETGASHQIDSGDFYPINGAAPQAYVFGTGEAQDGTGLRALTFPAPADFAYPGDVELSGPSVDKNGVVYGTSTNAILEDPDGNTAAEFVDSVGRYIPYPPASFSNGYWPSGCQVFSFPGIDGNASATVSDGQSGVGDTGSYTFCASPNQLSATRLNGCYSYTNYNPNQEEPLLDSVTLPNGKQYTFQYGDMGQLTYLGLPTGGSISYSYLPCGFFNDGTGVIFPAVSTRTVSDGTHSERWTYTIPPTGGPTIVTDPSGNDTAHYIGSGYEGETDYYSGTFVPSNPYGEPSKNGPCTGLPYASNLLKSVLTSYETIGKWQRAQIPISTTTILPTGQMSQVTYQYDGLDPSYTYYANGQYTTKPYQFDGLSPLSVTGNPVNQSIYMGSKTRERDYDWGQCAPGALLRTTNTQFAWQATGNNNAYFNANLVSIPTSVQTLDGSNNLVAETDYTYDEPNYLASAGNNGHVTSMSSKLLPGSAFTPPSHTYYKSDGIPWKTVDPNGNPTTISAFQCAGSLPQTVSNALGQTTNYVYDCNTSLLGSVLDPNNQTTSYTYDSMRDVTSVTYPDNTTGSPSIAVDYNGYATPLSVTVTQKAAPDPDIVTVTQYDGLARPIKKSITSDGAGADITDTSYDGMGRVYSVSNPYRSPSAAGDPPTGTTYYTYDALSRKTMVTEPDGSTLTWCYGGMPTSSISQCPSNQSSALGDWTDSYDEAGRHHQQVSNALGELTVVMEPDPVTNALALETDYNYDALGNLLTVNQMANWQCTHPFPLVTSCGRDSRTRAFQYDSLSRLTAACNPESFAPATTPPCSLTGNTNWSMQYTYDANGNMTSKTDARGVTVNYNPASNPIDALNRVTGKTYSGSNTNAQHIASLLGGTQYFYDQTSYNGVAIANGIVRRTSMDDPSGWTAWSYDSMGRTAGITQNVWDQMFGNDLFNGGTGCRTYTYGLAGQLSSDGCSGYYYDGAGGLISWGALWAQLTPGGNVKNLLRGVYDYTTSLYNWATTTTSYNNREQVTGITHSLQPSGSSAWTPFMNLTYTYNTAQKNDGNIVSVTDNLDSSRNQQYTYDYLNRLSSAGSGSWANTYGYDSFGNLNAKNNVAGSGETFNPGAPSTQNQFPSSFTYDGAGNMLNDGINSYTYDAEGRLASAGSVSYIYNGDGQRVIKNDAAHYNHYYFLNKDGQTTVDATDGGHNWFNFYFHGQLYIRYDVNDWPGSFAYTFFDHLGSARAILDGNGNVLQDKDYYPFGGTVAGMSSNTTANPYQFIGKYHDDESGLDYFGARYNSSNIGRFLSPDDASDQSPENPQSWNLYSYTRNNPVTHTDQDGHSVTVCDNNGQCNNVSNDAYTAAQQGNNSGLNVPTLNQVGSNGNGSGQFNSTAITDSNGNTVGTATYHSDGGADYYANSVGINQLSNTSQGVKAVTGTYAAVYGVVGAAVAGPAVASTAYRFILQRLALSATSPALLAAINKLYQEQDEVSGGTAGAVRNEVMTGEYINGGHSIKAGEMINRLNNLIQGGLDSHDHNIAERLISDLKSSLGR